MTIQVVVVGAGGFGREVCDVIEACNAVEPSRFELLGVLDDNPSETNLVRLAQRAIPFLGGVRDFVTENDPINIAYFVGIGAPRVKKLISDIFDEAGFRSVPLVHPDVTFGSLVSVSDGAVICAGVRATTNIQIGRHVHLNINTTVGHDTELRDFVSVNPLAAISGDVVIGEGALIGASAFLIQGITVGEWSTVGASACVTRDVETSSTVAGVPARQLGSK